MRSERNNFPIVLAFTISAMPAGAFAQARYDDHEMNDRFLLNFSGYQQIDYQTKIRLDSSNLGVGTVLDLEDGLNVDERSGTAFRLDGHYRFNRAHRIDFAWYRTDREGFARLFDEPIQIGDRIFQIDSSISSESESEILKIGYAWSFINVEPYEFYLGVGLNVQKNRLSFTGQLPSGEGVEIAEYEAEGTAPLPTLSFGFRYNLTDKWIARWNYEVFGVQVGDYGGRFQESTLSIEHNTWDHVGFGFGVTNFSKAIDAEDDKYTGEFDSSYLGLQLYLKTYF